MNWTKIEQRGEYSVWRHAEGYYQVTKGEYPSGEGGYKLLASLLGLKGIK